MELEQILNMLGEDTTYEYDAAIALRQSDPLLAAYRDGVAAGLSRAMEYLDLLVRQRKNAAMPASTAADLP